MLINSHDNETNSLERITDAGLSIYRAIPFTSKDGCLILHGLSHGSLCCCSAPRAGPRQETNRGPAEENQSEYSDLGHGDGSLLRRSRSLEARRHPAADRHLLQDCIYQRSGPPTVVSADALSNATLQVVYVRTTCDTPRRAPSEFLTQASFRFRVDDGLPRSASRGSDV